MTQMLKVSDSLEPGQLVERWVDKAGPPGR